jgi:Flp pilus assembly protein TadG
MQAPEGQDRGSTPRSAARRAGRRLRFLRDRRGATAVEFALVAPIFLALLAAIIEMLLGFWASIILETALNDAARQLYTGTFQAGHTSGTSKQMLDAFRSEQLCQANGGARVTIFTCNDVKIDVKTASQFPDAIPSPIDPSSSDGWASGFGTNYTSAKPGEIVVVQAAVKFPTFFSILLPNQGSFADGSRLLQSAIAFKAEPY